MLGVISASLGTVIERIEFGLELRCRQFQISFPSWGAVRDAEMNDFLTKRVGVFPRLSSCTTTRRAAAGCSPAANTGGWPR